MTNKASTENAKNWYTSKEAKQILKVSDCTLMHMRESGKLQFKKKGNAYFYFIDQKIPAGK